MKYFIRLIKHAKPYWGLLWLSGFSLLAVTGLNLIAPWLIRDLTALLTDIAEKSDFTKEVYFNKIVQIAIILVIVFLARMVFKFMNNYFSHKAAWNLVTDMRVIVYEHLQKLSLRFYQDKQTGQLMSRTTNDTATFEALIAHAVPDMVTNLLIFVGVSVILFFINVQLALLTFIPVPFLFFFSWYFSKKVRPNFREAQKSLAELNSTLQDNLSGMKEIQVFNQQHEEKANVEKDARSYSQALINALRLSAVFHPSIETLSSFGTVIVVGFGGWLALEAKLSVPDIVGFLLYLNLFYQPITALARVAEDLQSSLAGAERVFEVLDTEPDIVDASDAIKVKRGEGAIAFDDVSFHYIEQAPVLQKISFDVKPGEMLALVGPTGVGKTTLISLIARFYDPVAGVIRLDGQDISKLTLSSLRDQISIVLQDVFLFNGTVAENISYGNRKATKEEIIQAATIAHAHEFISELPEGYDTVIGERGVKLSGGQKQRLSIARAVLRDTPILILDEATSSVDVETEAAIQKAIQELAGSRTIIVIAHRLSTVKRADKILVISEGQIAEAGNHESLVKYDGLYKQLCDIQFTTLITGSGIA